MNTLYTIIEMVATFIESAIIFSVATTMAQRRYKGKKHITLTFIAVIISTVLITILNRWQAFSFVTIGIGLIYTFLALNVLSAGSASLKATATVMSWFFLFAIDYLLVYGFFMIIGKATDISHGFELILSSGTLRTTFLITDKFIQTLIFISCRKLYPKLQLLNTKNLRFIFVITFLSFIVIQVLTAITITDSLLSIQLAVVFTTFFIVLSEISTIFAIAISAKHQNEKRINEIMKLSSQLLEKNYNDIHSSHEVIRQQVHDFKNHIRTIDGMLDEDSKVKEYTQNLLKTTYSLSKLCNCGNDIIDSIINCKSAEANEKSIQFDYHISLSDALNVEPIDICAILANQIDNAIEACSRMKENDNNKIIIKIFQKESFVFFTVKNTAKENPFNRNNELLTTKNDKDGLHGFGIRIIRETAEKYNGTLKSSYNDGWFVSSVMLTGNN